MRLECWFAQRVLPIQRYLGQKGKGLSDVTKAHMRKGFEDLYSSLGEPLQPEEHQSIRGLYNLVRAIEENACFALMRREAISSTGLFSLTISGSCMLGRQLYNWSGIVGSVHCVHCPVEQI